MACWRRITSFGCRRREIPALWKALVEAGASPVGAASLEAFRIAEGIPAYGIDIAERDLPQETVADGDFFRDDEIYASE